MIRAANPEDVAALKALEDACFDSDRLSTRSFRRFLKRPSAVLMLDDEGGAVRGYGLALFHRNTSLARLYSFAVAPGLRERGIGAALMDALEAAAVDHGAVYMRLEVRVDNANAIAFYRRRGYAQFSVYPGYYEDATDALRMEKPLVPNLPADRARVPYYAQTLEFTCGPAALMMAMKALRPECVLDRATEIALWRESTAVFMTAGHGGCGPLGLALAAGRRGFGVEVRASDAVNMFVESVRDPVKRDVILLVEQGFEATAAARGILALAEAPTADDLDAWMAEGAVPLVLISSYRLTGDKAPHWVVVTDADARFVYVHDPYVDAELGHTETDSMGIPIRRDEFTRMSRYGRGRHFATVILRSHG